MLFYSLIPLTNQGWIKTVYSVNIYVIFIDRRFIMYFGLYFIVTNLESLEYLDNNLKYFLEGVSYATQHDFVMLG